MVPFEGVRRIGRPDGESAVVLLRAAAFAVWVALVVASVATFGASVEAVVDILGLAVIVAVTVTDLERRIVPNRIVVPALVAALLVQTVRDPSLEWLVASVGAGGFFLLLAMAYPAGLGMGDVKLAAFMGAWLGRDVAVALFAGSVLGAFPALVVLARGGASARTTTLPYVPALAVGTVIGLFFGDALLDSWLG
jgi:leader peptidase (prepilin peptidase)/N-methyltransferase